MKDRVLLYLTISPGMPGVHPAWAPEAGRHDNSPDGAAQGWEAGAFTPVPSAIAAAVGIDDVTAVPEPATIVLPAAGASGFEDAAGDRDSRH